MAEETPQEQLRGRTKRFALRVIRLYRSLPKGGEAQVLGKQVLRSGTSVGANYRAACRARSRPEWLAKMGIVTEEADESVYWMELLVEAEIVKQKQLEGLLQEARELTAIFTAAVDTGRKNL
ncbi:MAG: four helix bundle protein [Acidobacteria bacterium]|nr:four helix bundle protein [Acidobacteriota bacterium]